MPLIRLRFKPLPGMAGLICSSARMASDRFPANDQRILAGKERIPEEPLADLTSGVLDVAWMRLMNELTQALIQYTPPHFKTIHCKITEGLEQDQRALFYDIQCPEFSDEGSTVANDRVHRAATSVVQHLTAERGAFPGSSTRACTIPCLELANGSNRSCRVTSTTTQYQETSKASRRSGTARLGSGGGPFAAGARSIDSPGHAC